MSHRAFLGRRTTQLTLAVLVLLVLAGATAYTAALPSPGSQPEITLGEESASQSAARGPGGYSYRRLAAPNRTEIVDASGRTVAIMTDGARTANIYGASRTFQEPRFTKAKVRTNVWVRLAPRPWHAGAEKQAWFTNWLAATREDRSPDVLGVAMEYINGAPVKKDGEGQQFAGDASFGPLAPWDPDGREEASDFYDYLGMPWTFPDGKQEVPEPGRDLALDCSGYLRMVYGYRLGYPLRGTNTAGAGLPRRAYAMAEVGPGVQLMPNTGVRARGLERLLPGDMLFFNAGPVFDAHIEHSGIYMGVDDRGHHRFLSSRAQANGPTMGDLAGEPLLDGNGYWAQRWRTARRL